MRFPWNKGKKTGPLSVEHREKLSDSHKRSYANGRKSGMKGKKHSDATKEKMRKIMTGRKITWGDKISLAKKGKPNLKQRGEGNNLWKGGVSRINKNERNNFMQTIEYKNWRRKVFERDGYKCVECGLHSGNGKTVILHADHIKPYALYPKHRLSLRNGRTLCVECHKKSGTWGSLKKYCHV